MLPSILMLLGFGASAVGQQEDVPATCRWSIKLAVTCTPSMTLETTCRQSRTLAVTCHPTIEIT
jgi:hypothetical protein